MVAGVKLPVLSATCKPLPPPLFSLRSPLRRGLKFCFSPTLATALSPFFGMWACVPGPTFSRPPAETLSLRKGFEHGYGCIAYGDQVYSFT